MSIRSGTGPYLHLGGSQNKGPKIRQYDWEGSSLCFTILRSRRDEGRKKKEILGVDIEIQWQVRGNQEKPWDPFWP